MGRRSRKPDRVMNSRASWSVDGIEPSVRERAEAAARRAGMPLGDWLNSKLADNASPTVRELRQQFADESHDVADIHQRLDAITRQIDQISKPAPNNEASREQGVARQLNDAISRLDARLSQISRPPATRPNPFEARQHQLGTTERAPRPVYRDSPPLSPASLDVAVAEIAARQNELDTFASRQTPSRAAPPQAAAVAPPAPGADFSSLERYLVKITGQIEALQRPDHLEQSAATFRNELAEIGHAITEAMPRHAIESIESEIRSLHRRIDETRSSGTDGQALAGIEHTLSEIREVLRSLTPAEQLTGFDEAIRSLGAKLDLILRSNDDPSTVQKLEGAISALRAIVSNVASNEALTRLSEDVHLLAAKVDQIGRAASSNDKFFAMLEERITAMAAAMESREQPAAAESTERLETAIRALSERFDHLQVSNDSASTFAHLEQRVSYLLERVEASSNPNNSDLSRVEEGLHEILRYLEKQQAAFATLADRTPDSSDSAVVDLVKRELSDIRVSQAETDRHTQDSMEAVHNALGHLVSRLATIEDDLRAARAAPSAPQPMAAPSMPVEQAPMARRTAQPQRDVNLELPNPAAEQFATAAREYHAATPIPPPVPPASPRQIGEILGPHAAPAIAPELPPDHPLEPGTRPNGRTATPLERIAASESAISEIPPPPREQVASSSFIAAARRAAQAAAAQSEKPKPARRAAKAASSDLGRTNDKVKEKAKAGLPISPRLLMTSVGVVVVIALGAFVLTNMLGGGSAPTPKVAVQSSSKPPAPQIPAPQVLAPQAPAPQVQTPAEDKTKLFAPEQVTPSITSPTPLDRQTQGNSPRETQPAAAMPSDGSNRDVTGTVSTTPAGAKLGMVQVPPTEQLPDGIGGPMLLRAAMKGDATAAYEIGMRFAEGKGVAVNYEEAAKWYGRASQAGVVPATFRLGTLYEKGLGTKKDLDFARLYYTRAAEGGNAKAMHNLAVLDADGSGRSPNYKSAAQWFRKAADRGVADSQFNLGILYARGIGVEQNLAESYKWFSLAAAQGDRDAAAKRDDIAGRLDPESLAAAKLAIQTFSVEPQPDDAVNVATPAGGWDNAPARAATAKSTPRPAAIKRAAAR